MKVPMTVPDSVKLSAAVAPPDPRFGELFWPTEIDQLHSATVGQQNILRLDIAVNIPVGVGLDQGIASLYCMSSTVSL